MAEINSSVDPVKLIGQFNRQLSDFQRLRGSLEQEIVLIGITLDECIQDADDLSENLKTLKLNPKINAQKPADAVPPVQPAVSPVQGMSIEDFKGYIEKLLQGSLETIGDKVSDRIMSMLKELKSLAGTDREAKIQQIRETAASEMADLSALFKHEEIQSNLGELGIEEKESKGINSSLEKLREMRGFKPKPGEEPEK